MRSSQSESEVSIHAAIRSTVAWSVLLVGLLVGSPAQAQDTPPEGKPPEPAAAAPAEEAPAEETPAEAPAPPKTWASLTIEEKLDVLQASSVQLDDDGAVSANNLYSETNILWTCLAAFIVFFMQAGFTLVEAGFTRAKNCVNIIMKNIMDFSLGTIAFWAVGFGLMFGAGSGYVGTTDFFVTGMNEDGTLDHWTFAFWIFQVVFAATAATIVSGAMAERTKFTGYLCYSVGITAIVYPIFGSWAWGGLYHGSGWLESFTFGKASGFMDFAGSTVVHSVGGWAALAGAIVLGPRLGRYGADGKPNPIPGHSMTLAALGVFILWLGWFGFNPGSTTAVGGGEFARVAVTTNLAAAAGAVVAMIVSWLKFGKPDVSFTLNGALAGLVAITAPCYNVGPGSALAIGAVGGALVVFSVLFFDKLQIDDPVGAVSVHGVCGAWGTLATGLFCHSAYGGGPDGLLFGGGVDQLVIQAVGVLAAFAWAFPVSFVLFKAISMTIGLRVTPEEETEGLDIGEHGITAYPNFVNVESTMRH
ncbi:MAG: ammonium transporter [Planctomycetaceae bacterium]|nr:ammonium transporter [Planctomycetaceae bacterium]